jgi:hypothetical protein
MYECEIIELEDYNFNHVVHHYDEDIREMIEYIQEHDSAESHPEYYGNIYLDEK